MGTRSRMTAAGWIRLCTGGIFVALLALGGAAPPDGPPKRVKNPAPAAQPAGEGAPKRAADAAPAPVKSAAPAAAAADPKASDRESRLAARQTSRLNEEAADIFRNADTTFLVGDLNRASELFQKIVTAYPTCTFVTRAHTRLGDCAFEGKRFVDAATYYRRAAASAESASNDDETTAGVRADFMIGQCYLQAKLYSQAFGQFRRFIDRHPGHTLVNHAYQAIGDAHLALEQHQQALKAYRMVGTVIGEKTAAHRRIAPGQRLYLRVTDADVNVGEVPRSVTAHIRTTSGDVETVELEPLGQRSPVFLATIPTALGSPRHSDELRKVFSEAAAIAIRNNLAEADQLERTGRDKAEEALELDRSPQRTVNPAGTEKKRSALAAEGKQLLAKAKSLKDDSCKTIDSAFGAYEKVLARWAPEQSLEAHLKRRPATAPSTSPTTGPATAPAAPAEAADLLESTASKPLAGADEDEPAASPAADAERRGMTESELLQVRLAVSKSATNMENIDARLSTLSVWSRSLMRQFQRVELSGKDRIEIEYIDEVGPAGPNPAGKSLRKDVVEVASDATIDMLTPDGREQLPQVVMNSTILLRVEDADGDVSDQPDTLTAVLCAVPLTEQRPSDAGGPPAATPATNPTTQRLAPGELEAAPPKEPVLPLVPSGAASIKVTLTETGPHTGIFQRSLSVNDKAVLGDDGATLPMAVPGGAKDRLCSIRLSYADARAVRHPDGWVLARSVDCIGDTGGDVSAVKYRQTPLDVEAKLRRAVAAGEIGKIYLDLGLSTRGREYLASAQSDCDAIARAGDKTGLAEEALYHSWRIYFYAGLLDEAVSSCRTLMARYPKSDYIDDAMFAMGQASLERGRKQVELDKAAGAAKPTLNRDLARAVQQFDDLVKRFPASPLAPEALYQVGQSKIAAGQTGLDVFERLAKQYPDSVLAARGLVSVADYYLSIGDHARAQEYFGRVLIDYPDSPDQGKVLLQRGICQYKLAQYAEALQTFYRVVEEHSATDLAAEAQKHINFINQKRGGKNE